MPWLRLRQTKLWKCGVLSGDLKPRCPPRSLIRLIRGLVIWQAPCTGALFAHRQFHEGPPCVRMRFTESRDAHGPRSQLAVPARGSGSTFPRRVCFKSATSLAKSPNHKHERIRTQCCTFPLQFFLTFFLSSFLFFDLTFMQF